MKKSIFLINLMIIFIISCNSDSGMSTVNIQVGDKPASKYEIPTLPTSGIPLRAKSFVAKVYVNSVADGNMLFSSNFTLAEIIASLNVASLNIKSGADRIFVLEALDAEGFVSYRGESESLYLKSEEVLNITIVMKEIFKPTATLDITLKSADGDGSIDFFGEGEPAHIAGGEFWVSVFTSNNILFDRSAGDIELTCNAKGDYSDYDDIVYEGIVDGNTITGLKIPADSFVFVVVRTYAVDGQPSTWISYLGLGVASNIAQGETVNLNIEMQDPLLDIEGDWATAADWKEFFQCSEPINPL